MPAPTNLTPATAIPLTLPASTSQQVDFGGTTFTVWYSYTTQAGDDDLAFRFFSNVLAGPYNAQVEVMLGPIGAPVDYLGGYFAVDQPIIVPAPVPLVTPPTPGTLILFQVSPNGGGNPSPAILNITAQRAPTIASSAGHIFIPEFSFDGDAALVDETTGAVAGYRRLLGPSDFGDLLSGGIFAVDNGDTLNVDVWNNATNPLTAVASVAGSMSGSFNQIRSDRHDTFFFAHATSSVAALVKTVNRAGAVGGTSWTLPANSKSLRGMAPSRDQSILYYAQVVAGFPVHRFDLVNNIALSDLVAGVGTTTPLKDFFVLADGSILVGYHETNTIIRYGMTGGTIQSYVIPASLDRFFLDLDDLHLWAWSQNIGAGTTNLLKIRISDGAVLSTTPTGMFIAGISRQPVAVSMDAFGPAQSCPLLVFEPAPTPPPPTECDCIDVIHVGGPLSGASLSNMIPIGGPFETGDLDMLFGEQRFIIPHQQVSVSGIAQAFTITDEAMGLMIVTVNGDPIRWLVSGEDPTSSDGNVAVSQTALIIANITNAKNFRFILDAGSVTSEVVANFSRP